MAASCVTTCNAGVALLPLLANQQGRRLGQDDADGSGSGKAVEIASLDNNLKLTLEDLFVI
jgi:hypothetical protein